MAEQTEAEFNKQTYATHDDLNELRNDFKAEFKELRHEFSQSLTTLGDRLGRLGGTNWQVIIASLTVVLILAGMASTLVAYAITTESRARIAGDDTSEQIAKIRTTLIREAEGIEDLWENKLQKAAEKIETMRAEYAQQSRNLLDRSTTERIDTTKTDLKDLQESTSSRFKEIDIVLQREMRLLDEILQREMGLHVSRLEALIQVNRDDIDDIENTRFDSRSGDQLYDRLKMLEKNEN